MVFDIQQVDGETTLIVTHEGLTTAIDCYFACMPAWTQYIDHSLRQLIETGMGDLNLEVRTIDGPSANVEI